MTMSVVTTITCTRCDGASVPQDADYCALCDCKGVIEVDDDEEDRPWRDPNVEHRLGYAQLLGSRP